MDLYQKVERVIKDHMIQHQEEVYKGKRLLKKLESNPPKPKIVGKTGVVDLSNVFPDYTELPDD
jgi:hypothetical protein